MTSVTERVALSLLLCLESVSFCSKYHEFIVTSVFPLLIDLFFAAEEASDEILQCSVRIVQWVSHNSETIDTFLDAFLQRFKKDLTCLSPSCRERVFGVWMECLLTPTSSILSIGTPSPNRTISSFLEIILRGGRDSLASLRPIAPRNSTVSKELSFSKCGGGFNRFLRHIHQSFLNYFLGLVIEGNRVFAKANKLRKWETAITDVPMTSGRYSFRLSVRCVIALHLI
jgi:hypothetical protein